MLRTKQNLFIYYFYFKTHTDPTRWSMEENSPVGIMDHNSTTLTISFNLHDAYVKLFYDNCYKLVKIERYSQTKHLLVSY